MSTAARYVCRRAVWLAQSDMSAAARYVCRKAVCLPQSGESVAERHVYHSMACLTLRAMQIAVGQIVALRVKLPKGEITTAMGRPAQPMLGTSAGAPSTPEPDLGVQVNVESNMALSMELGRPYGASTTTP